MERDIEGIRAVAVAVDAARELFCLCSHDLGTADGGSGSQSLHCRSHMILRTRWNVKMEQKFEFGPCS